MVGDDKHHILDDTYTVRKADGTSETTGIIYRPTKISHFIEFSFPICFLDVLVANTPLSGLLP